MTGQPIKAGPFMSTLLGRSDTGDECKKVYTNPESVLNDSSLTVTEKGKILSGMEMDQLALLRAEGENMIEKCNGDSSSPAAMLAKIKKAENKLRASVKG